MKLKTFSKLKLSFACAAALVFNAPVAASNSPTYVENGVLKWTNGDEVALFGVNYNVPFAHGYRAIKRAGIDHKKAIDMDVDHIARLGLTAYRIHIWDRQISDHQGNLLTLKDGNDHLDLFDYAVKKFAEKNIKVVITTISWWGSGWPEPDPTEPGFSSLYEKYQMNQNPEAIKAQQKYLTQFLNHVNPYTGKTYQQDENIIAFELFNEPKHTATPQKSAAYIEKLIKTAKDAGVTKPLFYNTSEQGYDPDFAKALCETSIDGVAFQWYPTGLVKNSRFNSNVLPIVTRYTNPFADIKACDNKAKMVYEFDAADIDNAYTYPVMARSFREAGFQWATQFAYDPSVIAHTNSEYNTHYLNLLYTPKKAISLMIAAQVFTRQQRLANAGSYPQNNQFGEFNIDPVNNLSELNSDTHFYYSNSTQSQPVNPKKLQHIAGTSNSKAVQYSGSGAYFLDKLDSGVWQLEVYPDMQLIEDPYQNSSEHREVRRLFQTEQNMKLELTGLGNSFYIKGLNENNNFQTQAKSAEFKIKPGIYLLSKKQSVDSNITAKIDTYFNLPELSIKQLNNTPHHHPITVFHQPQREINQADKKVFKVQVSSEQTIESVELWVKYKGHRDFTALPMQQADDHWYQLNLPNTQDWNKAGQLEYMFVVKQANQTTTLPGHIKGKPSDWNFVAKQNTNNFPLYYKTNLKLKDAPVTLFDANQVQNAFVYPAQAKAQWQYVSGQMGNGLAIQLSIDGLDKTHNPLLRATLAEDNAMQHRQLTGYNTLVLKAKSASVAEHLQFALLNKHGLAYGASVKIGTDWQYVLIPLNKLKPVDTILPQAYPMFMPSVYPANKVKSQTFSTDDLTDMQGFQLSFDASKNSNLSNWHAVEIESVSLIKR
ncbi:hypothetical protein [Catenovulum adriaticum]|uniref:Cellulase (Glycosyl hydrolase family 5) n=1 Tax=Catenovulum adriaticum TaxID=2984846 RepID=A0ABY7AQ55_9ALTE|nr:hypothetical protein [Catenovulum sp. TS8]WAJ71684.1 hypothetical protein OLW01_15190 [Catenovulum sp. TS8]